MGVPAPEQLYWVIEPLLEVGLELQEIEALVVRSGFTAIVGSGVTGMTDVVRDQPDAVQAAWRHVVGRMLAVHG